MTTDDRDFLDELPVDGEEAQDSGIPEVLDLPVSDETDDTEPDSGVPEELAQDAQAEDEEPEATESPETAAAEPATEPSPDEPQDAPEGTQEPEPVETTATQANQVETTAQQPAPAVVPVAPAPPPPAVTAPEAEHGDLVTQTETPEFAPKLLSPGEQVSREVALQWDVMMAQLSDQTRLKVWEVGLDSMQKLLETPRNDLERPRGAFTAGQLGEIESWLMRNLGMRLAPTRKAAAQAFVPPPVKVNAAGIATRKMTPQLAAARKERLNAIRGDTRKR